MSTALLINPVYQKHQTGYDHPECPERIAALHNAFERSGLLARLPRVTVREASEDELALVHTPEYIATAKRDISSQRRQLTTGDTAISTASWAVALNAVGGVLNSVDAVFDGKARNAFCAVRPPGHHATPIRGMSTLTRNTGRS